MSDNRIEELDNAEPYERMWRRFRVGRSRLLAALTGTLVGLVIVGGLLYVERRDADALVAGAPCAPAGRPAKDVVRAFLDRVARHADRDALRSCWSDASVADQWTDRLAKTGGPLDLVILSSGRGSDPVGRPLTSVLAMPTWRIDADALWPSGRAKWFLLRDDGDGSWRLTQIQTPLWDIGSCQERTLAPEELVRTFFALLEERQPVGMIECWVKTPERDTIIDRYVATGGATALSITATKHLERGTAVRVFVQWRASPWSGDCCERWFVLHNDGGRWMIASVETSPPS